MEKRLNSPLDIKLAQFPDEELGVALEKKIKNRKVAGFNKILPEV